MRLTRERLKQIIKEELQEIAADEVKDTQPDESADIQLLKTMAVHSNRNNSYGEPLLNREFKGMRHVGGKMFNPSEELNIEMFKFLEAFRFNKKRKGDTEEVSVKRFAELLNQVLSFTSESGTHTIDFGMTSPNLRGFVLQPPLQDGETFKITLK